MLFKNLFRSPTPDDKQKKEAVGQVPAAEAQPAEETPPPPEAPATALELPPGHSLNLLWSLYFKRNEQAPRPLLDLAAGLIPAETSEEAQAPLSEDDLARELPRLEAFVDRTASVRLNGMLTEEGAPPPDLDAGIEVFQTAGGMTAWLLIYPPSGEGAEVSPELVERALGKAGVCFGVDEMLAKRLPGLPERYFRLHLIARGRPPVHGKDGYVVDLFSRHHTHTLSEDDSGRVNYAALELFQNAKKGDVICQIFPPSPCVNGTTVRNQVIAARAGKPAAVPRGRNTELSEDGSKLIAVLEGHVEFSGRNFQVKPVLEIPANVDFSTGNINSLGDIHIRGDIRSGFTVRTTGNITVDGVIEASTVEAGGDLVVRKGIQGSGQAVIHAHRNIYARFLESASIYVRENLNAECIINCDVYSDGAVTVRSGRGTIMGGSIHASREISADVVGARSEQPTAIFLDGKPCEEFERDGLRRESEELARNLEKLERQPDSPAKLQQMSKMRVQIAGNKMKLQRLDRELEELEDKDGMPRHGRLICGTLYPGTEISIGRAHMRVTHETRGCSATVFKGEIILI